jgi:protein-tyrosine phosphatase
MIDLHCHLLPGIDDGPKTEEDALELAHIASVNGITHAIVTPHIIPGRYDNTLHSIKTVFSGYYKRVKQENNSLQLGMAAEIRIDPIIKNMVETDSVPFLGEDNGFNIVLLEFPHDVLPPGSIEMVEWLLKRHIRPMIAHPERNQAVIRKFNVIEPFVKSGCLLQITSGSLSGVFGNEPKKTAKKLLKKGWVNVIASDAHNNHKRKPEIEPGRQIAEKIVGVTESWAMVRGRPQVYTRNKFGDW